MITNQFAPNVEGSLNTTIMFKDWYGRNSETKNGWLSEDFGAVNAMQFIESFLTLYFRKQYEADIIIGVLEGLITCGTLGFEDYPCEMTMIRWRLFPPRLFLLTAVPNLK